MSNNYEGTSTPTDYTVITDVDREPVKIDNNPAHFDGLLYEIAEFSNRSGKFLPLLEHGVVLSGKTTLLDSAAAVPFVQGLVRGARTYSAEDPCPPTDIRLAAHNTAMTAAGSPTIGGLARIPDSAKDYSVNPMRIKLEDLELGNSIAGCFEDTDYIDRIRVAFGRGGRALMLRLKDLADAAEPAEVTLVKARFTKYTETPVMTDLDAPGFAIWHKELNKLHRRMPRRSRKGDDEFCEYLNALFFTQPSWRDTFELRMSAAPAAAGDLNATLAIIRKMLSLRNTYAQLDAERGGGTRNLGLSVTHQAKASRRWPPPSRAPTSPRR